MDRRDSASQLRFVASKTHFADAIRNVCAAAESRATAGRVRFLQDVAESRRKRHAKFVLNVTASRQGKRPWGDNTSG